MTDGPTIRFQARCEACGGDIFNPKDIAVSYLVRGGYPEAIELRGREPWAGVRCVCRRCVRFFRIHAAP